MAKAWADLFSNGPDKLILERTGNYCFIENKTYISDEKFIITEMSRDELVENFRKLQFFSEKVISKNYLILDQGL